MSTRAMLLGYGLVAAAVAVAASEPVLAQGCGRRGPPPGSGPGQGPGSSLSPQMGAQMAGFQQNQGMAQLVAMQQAQALMMQRDMMQREMLAAAERRQQEARARAERRQQEQAENAALYRNLGDRFRAQEKTATAIANYRRAVAAAPTSADGRAAQAELIAYEAEAEDGLAEVEQLIADRDWEEASERLSELKRDYGKLPSAAQRISNLAGRVARVKQAVAAQPAPAAREGS